MERYALCTSDATSSGFFGNVVQQSKSCLAQAIGEASPQLAAALTRTCKERSAYLSCRMELKIKIEGSAGVSCSLSVKPEIWMDGRVVANTGRCAQTRSNPPDPNTEHRIARS